MTGFFYFGIAGGLIRSLGSKAAIVTYTRVSSARPKGNEFGLVKFIINVLKSKNTAQ